MLTAISTSSSTRRATRRPSSFLPRPAGVAAFAAAAAVCVAATLTSMSVAAQPAPTTVKLGVLSDFSSVYSTSGGAGLVAATKLAIEDFGKENKTLKVEVIFADHQNKPDVGAGIARKWYDQEGVDAILDVTNSPVAFAVVDVTRKANRVALLSAPGSSRLTGEMCTPNTIHWTYDTYEVGSVVGRAVTEAGNKTWFFITADYAFGQDLEANTTAMVKKLGGTVVGNVRVPVNSSDFSSYLLKAQASNAQVIGLAVAGNDLVTAVKQASEFGLTPKQNLAAINANIVDVHGIGLDIAKGLQLAEPFYWDLTPSTRAFTKRFVAINPASYPSLHHAAMYASTLHYLRAFAVAKTRDGDKIVAQMKATPTHDGLFSDGIIRADGRKIHDVYLFQVKTPAESKAPWDYYKVLATVPGDKAFRPMDEGNCPMVRK